MIRIFVGIITIFISLGCGRGGVSVVNPEWIGGSQIFEPKD
jgi:hypothetical protein